MSLTWELTSLPNRTIKECLKGRHEWAYAFYKDEYKRLTIMKGCRCGLCMVTIIPSRPVKRRYVSYVESQLPNTLLLKNGKTDQWKIITSTVYVAPVGTA